VLLTVHLSYTDHARRASEANALAALARRIVDGGAEKDLIVLGDFNEQHQRPNLPLFEQQGWMRLNRDATNLSSSEIYDNLLIDQVTSGSGTTVPEPTTACLVAIMAMGLGYHRQTERELTEVVRANHSLAPVMTSAGALIEGLKTMGAKRISLMAPYMRPLTDLVVKYIEHEGIEVIDSVCFEIPDNLEVGLRDPLRLLDDVQRLDTRGADVVVASACVQMQSLPAIQRLEDRLGIPTISTAVCTVRRMLEHLELEPTVPGAGALLAGRYPVLSLTK